MFGVMRSVRRIPLYLTLALAGAVIPLLLFEAGLRVEHLIRKGTPLLESPRDRWDPVLGWKGTEKILQGAPGGPVILVLGDSFTDGMGVPPEKMWYAQLHEALPGSTLIAYASPGYGTLQELLVLKNYISEGLSPQLVVVQLCTNDILNNYFELDRASLLQRAPAPRPYLENGEINIRFPRSYGWFLGPLISFSRVAYRYETRWEEKTAQRAGRGELPSVEHEIGRKGGRMKAFKEAGAVTDDLIGRMQKEAGNGRLVLFLINDIEPYTGALARIASSRGIPFVNGVRLTAIDGSGKLPDGAHYNEKGNKALGEALVAAMKERRILLQQ